MYSIVWITVLLILPFCVESQSLSDLVENNVNYCNGDVVDISCPLGTRVNITHAWFAYVHNVSEAGDECHQHLNASKQCLRKVSYFNATYYSEIITKCQGRRMCSGLLAYVGDPGNCQGHHSPADYLFMAYECYPDTLAGISSSSTASSLHTSPVTAEISSNGGSTASSSRSIFTHSTTQRNPPLSTNTQGSSTRSSISTGGSSRSTRPVVAPSTQRGSTVCPPVTYTHSSRATPSTPIKTTSHWVHSTSNWRVPLTSSWTHSTTKTTSPWTHRTTAYWPHSTSPHSTVLVSKDTTVRITSTSIIVSPTTTTTHVRGPPIFVKSPNSTSKGLIVGLSVTGVLLLIILIAPIIWCIRNRNSEPKNRRLEESDDSTSSVRYEGKREVAIIEGLDNPNYEQSKTQNKRYSPDIADVTYSNIMVVNEGRTDTSRNQGAEELSSQAYVDIVI